MHRGLHERLVTTELEDVLRPIPNELVTIAEIGDSEQPQVLARHVYEVMLSALSREKDAARRLEMVNAVVSNLDALSVATSPSRQLIRLDEAGSVDAYGSQRPTTALSDAALLTNAPNEPGLGSELRLEIDTSDEVDLLCAFVKWHGLRMLEPELRRLSERGVRMRVITTTYMGATERRALDRLVREFKAEVKVHYDNARTRLHAKAWLFRRHTHFDTAYVGSSNLSRAALLDGVEWNVRLSRVGTPHLLDKFEKTFTTYWNDPSFESYDPDRDAQRLDDALAQAGHGGSVPLTISLSGLEVRPFPYQQEMLEAIAAERREHDRHRNLVVAATGTGKTVLAALDYRNLCAQWSSRPTLLFVAHRREILEQSLRTYREVLVDPSFGEMYVGGERPHHWKHVFATVQSLSNSIGAIAPDAFDVVVIDEFHHAQAPTYRALLEHLAPRELLGLTATPERADGLDVREFFDGRIAAELRLWDALGADLLCPFHYFAVADGTDLRQISWARGRYDERELDNVYTGNDARAAVVLQQLQDKVNDPGAMRALGFCVSVAHAEFMAKAFTDAGVPALAVSGSTSLADRRAAIQDLRSRKVNALFAADLFNEGLDIPEVDTVLFLRPTESATIFLQQLGRGLRRAPDKPVLTVLDFIGFQRKEFRFDLKLRALTGQTRRGLERDIERGFPFLPSGSQILLEEQAREIILANIRTQVGNRWNQMVAELRRHDDPRLDVFLNESGLELSDILRRGSWTRLRREAGLPSAEPTPMEEKLLKRVRAFAHVDDRLRAQAYDALLDDGAPAYADLSAPEQRLAQMLFFSVWPDGGGHESYEAGLAALRAEPATRSELRSVVDLSFESARHQALELTAHLAHVPLRVHARYQREEVLAALGYASLDRKPNSFREGVLYASDLNVDAFFVTLKKSESDYSPTTMYRDYPISPELFHWESQSVTSVASPTGQRYITGSSTVLLFVRQEQKDAFGTSSYLFAGPMTYVSHEGERPIALTWKLDHTLPADFYSAASVVAL